MRRSGFAVTLCAQGRCEICDGAAGKRLETRPHDGPRSRPALQELQHFAWGCLEAGRVAARRAMRGGAGGRSGWPDGASTYSTRALRTLFEKEMGR